MNSFMRIILFFDLPMITEEEKRIYTRFRKELVRNGYMMLQFSVYSKICTNREAAVNNILKIKKNIPEKGSIRILLVTEKQYAKMEIILGGKSKIENIITIDPLIIC